MIYVLDASAILALLQGEQGGARVREVLDDAIMSSVNYAEVLAKCSDKGGRLEDAETQVGGLRLDVKPFGKDDAIEAARLRPKTRRPHDISFADRACLALAHSVSGTALTGDRVWADLDLGIRVELFR